MAGSGSRLLALGAVLALLAPSSPVAAEASAAPLLEYASTLSFPTLPHDTALRERLAQATHAIDQHRPPRADCARTLGAGRFSALLDELGAARAALGDYAGAVEAFDRALECTPRAVYLHAALAAELAHLGRLEEARAAARRGLAIAPDDTRLVGLLARLDFIEGRWPEAIARLRVAVTTEADPQQATYWQCFLWLAQRRAGVRRPALADRAPVEEWPRPILQMLRGSLTEEELLAAVRAEGDEMRRREMLAEALYYAGQKRLAAGDTATARDYLAATANLKLLYFVEHHMALAELTRLR